MITEHNCEEYFLLYIDNELSIAERKAVEDFVDQNPQYNLLFSTLQETKLPADDSPSFFSKESLYKDETAEIGINNYEDYFLLYTDNELGEEQKKTTERFVLQHPQLQEEFVLLQQAKLTPEIVEYKNKEELYKRERRVLPFYMAGLSVAAAFLAVLFFTGIFTPDQKQDGTMAATVIKKDDETSHQQKPAVVSPAGVTSHQNEEKQTDLAADKLTDQSTRNKSGKKDGFAVIEPGNRESEEPGTIQLHQSHHDEVAVAAIPEDRQATQALLPNNNLTAKQAGVLKPLVEFDAEQTNATTALSLSDNSAAQPAFYKELNTEDDDHTLYVSGLPINKNKVNGFIKSASRLLGGHAKQNEE